MKVITPEKIQNNNPLMGIRHNSQIISQQRTKGKDKPSDVFSMYRKIHKCLAGVKYNKKKYDHDYGMRSYNILNISVPKDIQEHDNLSCLPLIKKKKVKSSLKNRFLLNDKLKILEEHIGEFLS